MKIELDLDEEEVVVLADIYEEAIGIAQAQLEYITSHDQMPETVEEFTAVVGTQQERIALLQRLGRHLGKEY